MLAQRSHQREERSVVGLVGCNCDVGARVEFAGHRLVSSRSLCLRFKRQQNTVEPETEPAARVQIRQTEHVEQFVRPAAQHLTFAAELLDHHLKHHAGVVVQSSSHGQVDGKRWRGWGERRERRERGFKLVKCVERHAVHARKQCTGRAERFHPAVQGSKGPQRLGVDWVETVR